MNGQHRHTKRHCPNANGLAALRAEPRGTPPRISLSLSLSLRKAPVADLQATCTLNITGPNEDSGSNFYVMRPNSFDMAWAPILGQGNLHKTSRFGRIVWAAAP
jgi:hypothetical protein